MALMNKTGGTSCLHEQRVEAGWWRPPAWRRPCRVGRGANPPHQHALVPHPVPWKRAVGAAIVLSTVFYAYPLTVIILGIGTSPHLKFRLEERRTTVMFQLTVQFAALCSLQLSNLVLYLGLSKTATLWLPWTSVFSHCFACIISFIVKNNN